MVNSKIKIKRGLKINMPVLDEAEFGFTTDEKKVYIGDGTINHLVSGPVISNDLEIDKLSTAKVPSVKAVYDLAGNIEDALDIINSTLDAVLGV